MDSGLKEWPRQDNHYNDAKGDATFILNRGRAKIKHNNSEDTRANENNKCKSSISYLKHAYGL